MVSILIIKSGQNYFTYESKKVSHVWYQHILIINWSNIMSQESLYCSIASCFTEF